MLVLARKELEKIVVITEEGVEIFITMIKIKGKRVRLGIDAPKDIHIKRLELEDKGI